MNIKDFSQAMDKINIKYIDEAASYQKKIKKYQKAKWVIAAACFAASVFITALLYSSLPEKSNDIITLDNGDKIIFVKSGTPGLASLLPDIDITAKRLTEEETSSLFAGLPVTAYAIYSGSYSSTKELIGFEAKYGNIKIIISLSDINLFDTVVSGSTEKTEVNGANITAWYFITDKNSQGKKNVIYYAISELENSKIYIENKGTEDNRETIKNELAEVIEKLTGKAALDGI